MCRWGSPRHDLRSRADWKYGLRVAESFPAQYFNELVSLLSDGCETFGEIDVTRNGTTVRIDAWNVRPHPSLDTARILVIAEEQNNVVLGSNFESGFECMLITNDFEAISVARYAGASLAVAHPVRDPFRHHDRRRVSVGAGRLRKYRCVRHPQGMQAVDLPVLIDHRIGVSSWAHRTGGGGVVSGSDVGADPPVERGVRVEVCVEWTVATLDQLFELRPRG